MVDVDVFVTIVVAARAVADADVDAASTTSGVGAHAAADSATISTARFLVTSRSNRLNNSNTISSKGRRHV